MIWRRARQRDGDGDRGEGAGSAGAAGTGVPADPVTDDAASYDSVTDDAATYDSVVGTGVPEDSVTDPDEQRRALIDLVIYAYDRTTSSAIQARLADGLREVGVSAVVPDGERFDPSRHEAGGTEPTDDDALHDLIAETERAGFRDGDRPIRDPIVVVYRRR